MAMGMGMGVWGYAGQGQARVNVLTLHKVQCYTLNIAVPFYPVAIQVTLHIHLSLGAGWMLCSRGYGYG